MNIQQINSCCGRLVFINQRHKKQNFHFLFFLSLKVTTDAESATVNAANVLANGESQRYEIEKMDVGRSLCICFSKVFGTPNQFVCKRRHAHRNRSSRWFIESTRACSAASCCDKTNTPPNDNDQWVFVFIFLFFFHSNIWLLQEVMTCCLFACAHAKSTMVFHRNTYDNRS